MKRVMICGASGSGKSTLARQLGTLTGLPVQYMDHIHWQSGWVERTQEEKLALISVVEAQDRWIIEGGISARYAERLERADIIVWLDLPVGLRMWRVLRRSWQFRGRTRPDLPDGCPERFNYDLVVFLIWVWKNRHTSQIKIVQAIAADDSETPLHHLRSPQEVDVFMVEFAADLPLQ